LVGWFCAGGRQQVQLLSINAYNFKATLDQAMLTALSDSETVRHTHTHTHRQPFLCVQSFFFTFGMTNDHLPRQARDTPSFHKESSLSKSQNGHGLISAGECDRAEEN
jgi:hypothetical protein